MENKENNSLTEALEGAMGEMEGHYEGLADAIKQELGGDSIGMTDSETRIAIKMNQLLLRIGAYVMDHADTCSEILSVFQTDVYELETLCNQQEESKEDKEQD